MFKIIRSKDTVEKKGHCGVIKKLKEKRDISFTDVKIKNSEEHYHKESTEYYFVKKGKGKIKLNEEVYDISEGDLIEIPPKIKHKAFDEEDLEILVIAMPPLKSEDHYF